MVSETSDFAQLLQNFDTIGTLEDKKCHNQGSAEFALLYRSALLFIEQS